MSNYKKLVTLRALYPSTTAAAQNLVMRAAELKRAREYQIRIELNGTFTAQVAFENAMKETLLWAARESRELSSERLFKFTMSIFAQFSLEYPSWYKVLPEISDYLLDLTSSEPSKLDDTVEQVKREHSSKKRKLEASKDQHLVFPLYANSPSSPFNHAVQ
ncbi:hypothetical protein [Ruegeria arenilitoris]|uniref:hypothetical protein n=1 Tax=Ruegeria arenilitoris TaxID=1173585 RepID=UPI00147B6EE1|nr:hypothetical protein [Ruegeria arenilitoris]